MTDLRAAADAMGPVPDETLACFRATKRECADLEQAIGADLGSEYGTVRGLLYWGPEDGSGGLYIEEVHEQNPNRSKGRWYLLVERSDWISDDLAGLERILCAWALAEGYMNP